MILIFWFLDGDVPRSLSYGAYNLQLISFARLCSNVSDFNRRNQATKYHKLRKNVLLFYHRHSELFVKYNVGLMKELALLQQGISEPVI